MSCNCNSHNQSHHCCSSSCSTAEQHAHSNMHSHHHDHEHSHGDGDAKSELIFSLITFVLLVIGLVFEYAIQPHWFHGVVRSIWYIVAVIPVGWNIAREAFVLIFGHADVFNEIVLMLVATIGAMAIGEYPEAVMLLLLYTIGEYLEHRANSRARKSIASLIDTRPEQVTRLVGNTKELVAPSVCIPGDKLLILPGERVALDGTLLSLSGTLNMAALTGESMPVELYEGSEVKAGAIVVSSPIQIEVAKPFGESTLARILQLVDNASENKPKTERFIRRFARVYTPIVFALAVLVVLIPFVISLFSSSYVFNFSNSFYKALVFLVTSCPCALIIGIPLSYYSGIGAASKHGLIFKGARFLELLPQIRTFIFDKTGTLTKGMFKVTNELCLINESDVHEVQRVVLTLEEQSTHPVAEAICDYLIAKGTTPLSDINLHMEELPGMGMRYSQDDTVILVGNPKLMASHGVSINNEEISNAGETVIYVAQNGRLVMCFKLSDEVKPSSHRAIEQLKKSGYFSAMLSGDNSQTVEAVAKLLSIDEAWGNLMPEDKITHMKRLRQQGAIAFVGDGINDAPVMAVSDLSFAMGGVGSDAAIEAADVIIQSDDPYKTVEAVEIARKTHRIVVSNIILILFVKLLVMLLALLGVGTLIMAILADVGVTLLAILNALRLLRYKVK